MNALAPKGTQLNLLVVDDHTLFRQGLKFLLRDLDENLGITEASDCTQAVALKDNRFDLILLDLHMPGTVGLDALTAMKEAYEATRIVVLSGEEDPRLVRRAIENGATGFVPKSSTPELLLSALQIVLSGSVYLPPLALKDIDTEPPRDVPPPPPPASPNTLSTLLSPRQLEVLHKAIVGKPNKVIARELDISEGTVKAHLAAAFLALGVRNRTEAVYVAARMGMQILN